MPSHAASHRAASSARHVATPDWVSKIIGCSLVRTACSCKLQACQVDMSECECWPLDAQSYLSPHLALIRWTVGHASDLVRTFLQWLSSMCAGASAVWLCVVQNGVELTFARPFTNRAYGSVTTLVSAQSALLV
jgi:hypothetical protein